MSWEFFDTLLWVRFCMGMKIYLKPCTFFPAQEILYQIVPLRCVNKIFPESYDFVATESTWNVINWGELVSSSCCTAHPPSTDLENKFFYTPIYLLYTPIYFLHIITLPNIPGDISQSADTGDPEEILHPTHWQWHCRPSRLCHTP
jgi:hypothetical protein